MDILSEVLNYTPGGLIGLFLLWALLSSVTIVGGQNIVVLERRWIGKSMPDGRTVALSNEVGVQARILGPGFHLLIPFIYKRKKHGFVIIKPGQVGLVESITGKSLPNDKIMAEPVDCELFQNGEAFIKNGGEKGRQLMILPEGEYRINPHLFHVTIQNGVSIGEDEVGIVESIAGKPVERIGGNFGKPVECDSFQDAAAFLKAGGERGPQIDFLKPGYYRINKLMFNVRNDKIIEIPGGEIGLVEALDGKKIEESRILGKKVEGHGNFFDGQAFIKAGGERGRQIEILMPGKYRINTDLFRITTGIEGTKLIEIAADEIGIVTTLEGKSIKDKNKIAADELPMEDHNNFQDPQSYLDKNGQKGLQIPVLRAGQYAINPWFAKVEKEKMTEVKIGNCAVITSYVGQDGADTSNDTVNAEIVENGNRGIWKDPLQPGLHPINRRICSVAIVPTIQILLSWADARTEAHKLDSNLKTIVLRTKDAFNVSMDVNVIVHIPMKNAPKVIANLGSVEEMISQVLEPAISAHFRNAAQKTPALDLYTKRMELQESAKEHIAAVLAAHHIDSKDTLIADVVLPTELTDPVQKAEIAVQNKIMFGIQKEEEDARIQFENSREQANQQQAVVESERNVDISKNKAQSEIAEAEGKKKAKVLTAEGDAEAVKLEAAASAEAIKLKGVAEGDAIYAVGSNQAKVTKEQGLAVAESYEKQVAAMGESGFVKMMIMEKMSALKDMTLVPQNIVMTGGHDGSDGTASMLQGYFGLGLIERMSGVKLAHEVNPEIQKAKDETSSVKEDKSTIILTSYEPSKKTAVIKVVREITGFNLVDAKKSIEELPLVVKNDLDSKESKLLKEQLENAGASINIISQK